MPFRKFIKEKLLPVYANLYAEDILLNTQLNLAISRSAVIPVRKVIDSTDPRTWECSGFSQNGEDGIIEYLISGLNNPNKYFIEIGSGNGLENNTSYLGHIKKYAGLQIEGDSVAHAHAVKIKPWLVECTNRFVDTNNHSFFFEEVVYKNPDVFSIDIDGVDYHITKSLLENGLLPKIIIVEYNSAFGPDESITIPNDAKFSMFKTEYPYLYYGASIKGWTKLLNDYQYEFISVESNGVNGFFARAIEFKKDFFAGLEKVEFRENLHQLRLYKGDHNSQFDLIKDLPLEYL